MALRIERNIPLATYTTLHVGGVAAYFYRLRNDAVLAELVDFAHAKKVPLLMLGGGSNVLIADGMINRLVIKSELTGVSYSETSDGVLVTAAAGELWDELVASVVARGLRGLENLSGIPGTVGAAPIQNINAYGAQVADAIASVTVFDTTSKTVRELSAADCQFGYRDSIFKHAAGSNFIVLAVTFKLHVAANTNLEYRSASQSISRYLEEQKITTPSVADVRAAILHVRSTIGMIAGQFRSAGSFFKNTIVSAEVFAQIEQIVQERFSKESDQFSPWHWSLPDGTEKVSTAFLMECSEYNKRTYGVKRYKGVVGLSPKHSLSIVTEDGATASDVYEFAEAVIAAVKKNFGVTIESEVIFIL